MTLLVYIALLALPWLSAEEWDDDVAATVLWVVGDASVPAEEDILAEPLSTGDRCFHGQVLKLDDGAAVSLLVGDDVLARLSGPGVFRFERDRGLKTVVGPGRVEQRVLEGFVIGPRERAPPAPAPAAPDEDVELSVESPRFTTTLADRPLLRWRRRSEGGRFDLALWRSNDDGAAVLIERWRNLAGRSHVLWVPLERGRRYRWTVSVASGVDLLRPSEATAWFEVLSASRVRDVRAGQALLDRLVAEGEDRPDVAVLRAFFLESHGLVEQAEAIWATIADHAGADSGSRQAARRHRARLELRQSIPRAVTRRVALPLGFELVLPRVRWPGR